MFKIKPLKRTFILLLVLVMMLAILVNYQTSQVPRNKVVRPAPMADLIVNLPDDFAFRQDNPKWGARKLGKTDDSLSDYGCTLTSVAIAASNLLKTEISPAEMNTRLTDVGGFTKTGLLIWKHVSTATDGKLRAVMTTDPSHEAITQCMQTGGYPIIKIDIGERINHWVVIVGKSEDDYYIRDPLIGQASDSPVALSSRSDYIYATRCVSLNTD